MMESYKISTPALVGSCQIHIISLSWGILVELHLQRQLVMECGLST